MTFWQENYSFIKEVYDTRYCKMVEWMDNVEMAIQKVIASKVYSSAEFKREKDNFHSLCKNLERAETRRWLAETLDTLMKERAGGDTLAKCEERKEEQRKLEAIVERHKALIPRIQETIVRTECYWKCYSYGDDLLPIFEFIDTLRHSSCKEVHSSNQDQTEEHLERQDKLINQLENKRRMVKEFIEKGEKLLADPNCPVFLEGHLQKLKDAWQDTVEKAQKRKKALQDNFSSWEVFDQHRDSCHRQLDKADEEEREVRKVFNLEEGPRDFQRRKEDIERNKREIMSVFESTSSCNSCIQEMLPLDKKEDMAKQVRAIEKRLDVIKRTEQKLEAVDKFNGRLAELDKGVSNTEGWLKDIRKEIDDLVKPARDAAAFSPEDRVTRAMEIQEDLIEKSQLLKEQEKEKEEILPKSGEDVPDGAQSFIDRVEGARRQLDQIIEEVNTECCKFSQDIKFWAEFQTGVRRFEPWMSEAERREERGLGRPEDLEGAEKLLEEAKAFQSECESKLLFLEDSAKSASQMTIHAEADERVEALKCRWGKVHDTSLDWVSRMSILVECWNKLEGNVDRLNSWVTQDGTLAEPESGANITMEKLESQLSQLKEMFVEKQKLVAELEAYGKKAASSGEGGGDKIEESSSESKKEETEEKKGNKEEEEEAAEAKT